MVVAISKRGFWPWPCRRQGHGAGPVREVVTPAIGDVVSDQIVDELEAEGDRAWFGTESFEFVGGLLGVNVGASRRRLG